MRSIARYFALLVIVTTSAAPTSAFDFVVTRYDDPVPDGCLATDCSLREAVIAANADVDADRILLSAGTYSVDLVGSDPGPAQDGALVLEQDVEVIGLGAGMTVLDATGLGDVVLTASENHLDFGLRGVTVRDSSIGAISLGVGTHLVEECEFTGNGSSTSHVAVRVSIGATVSFRSSSAFANTGRGMSVIQGAATIENSTFSGNGAAEILVDAAAAFVCSHCTIVDPADSDTELQVGDSVASLSNTVISGNCVFPGTGSIDSLGGNVESTGDSCQFDHASDQTEVVAQSLALGALADNGGPTWTHLPTALSILNGSANDALCLPTDQRGVERSTNCESGAVERGTRPPTPIFHDGFLQGDAGAWSDAVGYLP